MDEIRVFSMFWGSFFPLKHKNLKPVAARITIRTIRILPFRGKCLRSEGTLKLPLGFPERTRRIIGDSVFNAVTLTFPWCGPFTNPAWPDKKF
jgi:hypothetical protein